LVLARDGADYLFAQAAGWAWPREIRLAAAGRPGSNLILGTFWSAMDSLPWEAAAALPSSDEELKGVSALYEKFEDMRVAHWVGEPGDASLRPWLALFQRVGGVRLQIPLYIDIESAAVMAPIPEEELSPARYAAQLRAKSAAAMSACMSKGRAGGWLLMGIGMEHIPRKERHSNVLLFDLARRLVHRIEPHGRAVDDPAQGAFCGFYDTPAMDACIERWLASLAAHGEKWTLCVDPATPTPPAVVPGDAQPASPASPPGVGVQSRTTWPGGARDVFCAAWAEALAITAIERGGLAGVEAQFASAPEAAQRALVGFLSHICGSSPPIAHA
jgi:hypothetical protein